MTMQKGVKSITILKTFQCFVIAAVHVFAIWNRHKLSTRRMIHPLHVCQGLLTLKPFDPWMNQLT